MHVIASSYLTRHPYDSVQPMIPFSRVCVASSWPEAVEEEVGAKGEGRGRSDEWEGRSRSVGKKEATDGGQPSRSRLRL
jgi:hypothetical protein